ncbi:hypothetical protein CHU92_12515 [Flavobacterium cyanobacteriorum]|uniref:Uncharacterized protein n=2 Tax=Flavobacterium cyanobacteriorum TaxID=2022802 RepID=A0A255YZ22_9FLAO|nr:hypothetical protein CHU92_12515 [Flavobacterium cyanobacteriorum]
MKAYNYFLFRIYMFYKDTMKEKDFLILATSVVSTLVILINLLTLYYIFVFLKIIPQIPNKYYTIFVGVLLCLLNYRFMIKNKNFLNYNFNKDKKGGYFIISIFILTVILFITIANIYRARVFNL